MTTEPLDHRVEEGEPDHDLEAFVREMCPGAPPGRHETHVFSYAVEGPDGEPAGIVESRVAMYTNVRPHPPTDPLVARRRIEEILAEDDDDGPDDGLE